MSTKDLIVMIKNSLLVVFENLTKKDKDSFFTEFRNILVTRCGDNSLETDQDNGAAQDFARYLRAARSNAGWSPQELAKKANLSEVEIIALERGLIPSTRIKPESLRTLAKALGEDIDDFALMLEREIPEPQAKERPMRKQILETGGNQALRPLRPLSPLMNGGNCYQAIVTDRRERVVIDWTASLFSRVTIKTEGSKMIIVKKSLFGTETYIPSINESVKTRNWLSVQLQRYRSKR